MDFNRANFLVVKFTALAPYGNNSNIIHVDHLDSYVDQYKCNQDVVEVALVGW